jgi:competence ComEA-like helix-hairpin-helix protein
MKDKSTFRLLTLGFLSGIIISGLTFLVVISFHNQSRQERMVEVLPVPASPIEQTNPILSNNKLNLNQATVAQLVALPGIGEAKANAIIDFRIKYGDFEEISELTYVTGIGNTLLKSIQDLVIIN